jgi:hypothetical protein
MHTVLGLLLAALPIVLVVALFRLVGATQRRRAAAIARQIHLTDQVHARLGAVVAPFVEKPLGRPWQVLVSVPLDRPELVTALVEIVADDFAARSPRRPEPFQIVLSPREQPVPLASRSVAAAPRRAESMSWT